MAIESQRKKLRKKIIGKCKQGKCGICGVVDDVRVFDVDHKIPLSMGGCNEPWNVWTLCLRDHRLKTLAEQSYARTKLQVNEMICFACDTIVSKYFNASPFWCKSCLQSDLGSRVSAMERNISLRTATVIQ